MSGHSKWSQIKRKKEAKDKMKGNIFSKLSRLITLAVIEGGGVTDPQNNIRLRLAVEKAKQYNMPKENITRSIEKALGTSSQLIKEVIFEAFGPSGVAFVIVAATDNINRTTSQIKNLVEGYGGKLGGHNSVLHLFKKCARVVFKEGAKEEEVFNFAQKIGAFDIDQDDNYSVYIPFENLGKVKQFCAGLEYQSAEIDYKPQTLMKIENREAANKVIDLVEALEELDDVQKVFSNFDIPEQFLTKDDVHG